MITSQTWAEKYRIPGNVKKMEAFVVLLLSLSCSLFVGKGLGKGLLDNAHGVLGALDGKSNGARIVVNLIVVLALKSLVAVKVDFLCKTKKQDETRLAEKKRVETAFAFCLTSNFSFSTCWRQ